MKIMRFITALSLLLFISYASASWLSKITGISIDFSTATVKFSKPEPKAIPEMLKNLPKDAAQFFLNPAGNALALAIRTSKNAAKNTKPLPDSLKQELTGYFPKEILDQVRWTDNPGSLSLAKILRDWLKQEGAITLDNVIVFSNSNLLNDTELVAHELTHVMQYRAMGIDTFASVYIYASYDLETQARQTASGIISAKLKEQRNLVQIDPGYSKSEPISSIMVANIVRNLGKNAFKGVARDCLRRVNNFYAVNKCSQNINVLVLTLKNGGGEEQVYCQGNLNVCTLRPNGTIPVKTIKGRDITDVLVEWP
ncbi:eCIS core domain-containing protein [Deinococcus aquatilis]|uniref:eCIS core domain-containing protein n=1 Tax=Deinococcus aquatilis TaxID=519440 RepID=UPI00036079B8|nr:DUF4157 domain-containing protein [Deinococcus aquatilis]